MTPLDENGLTLNVLKFNRDHERPFLKDVSVPHYRPLIFQVVIAPFRSFNKTLSMIKKINDTEVAPDMWTNRCNWQGNLNLLEDNIKANCI